MNKLRVLYILHHFPQISETYIRSEIEALQNECEIKVVSLCQADYSYRNHVPFDLTDDSEQIERIIDEFRPDVLHSHWLQQARILGRFSGCFGLVKREIPFTIRSHSFDVLEQEGAHIRQAAPLVNSELCLGILAFPFARPQLESHGISADKIHDCYPVVNYRRFHDPSPNGKAVMNVGACLPKKQMEDYLELAAAFPGRRFDLYALGYATPEITRKNAGRGNPVTIVPPVEPDEMACEYKKHEWLVYTASRKMNSVGWPLAVAEAQAAGVGVCLPNIRPDLSQYLGGAGYLYDSISEVAELLRRPFPDEMRERGFEQARRSDIGRHKSILENVWRRVGTVRTNSEPTNAMLSAEAWGCGSSYLEKRERLRLAREELLSAIPAGDTYILVDEEALGRDFVPQRSAIRFMERDGQSWGLPENDAMAVGELERMRKSGAIFLAFAWPAFWWLDHYSGLKEYLDSHYRPVLQNDRLKIYSARRGAMTNQNAD
jgi:hypothetical protein